MLPPMTKDSNSNTSDSIKHAAKVVAEKSMLDDSDSDTADVDVSNTWHMAKTRIRVNEWHYDSNIC